MLDHTKPATAARAAMQPPSKPTRTGYEPRPEAEETGAHRELKAFALIVGVGLLCLVVYELTTSL